MNWTELNPFTWASDSYIVRLVRGRAIAYHDGQVIGIHQDVGGAKQECQQHKEFYHDRNQHTIRTISTASNCN
jgi:hypothetical protein